MADFLKKAFQDMKDNAKAQHEVDKANFAAVKAESKANFEEVKARNNPEVRKSEMQAERERLLAEAKKREADANARINAINNH